MSGYEYPAPADRKVRIVEGWQQIGKYGYAHYTGECLLGNEHKLALIPQSVVDGWKALCRCGEWAAWASFYVYPTKDDVLAALREAHAKHVSAQEGLK